jgi:hypothetical protein
MTRCPPAELPVPVASPPVAETVKPAAEAGDREAARRAAELEALVADLLVRYCLAKTGGAPLETVPTSPRVRPPVGTSAACRGDGPWHSPSSQAAPTSISSEDETDPNNPPKGLSHVRTQRS